MKTGLLAVGLYLLGANLGALLLCGWDKRAARRGRRRVPERRLFCWALLGGSAGLWAGMRLFHHKTRHPAFIWGVPAILAGQLLLAGGLWWLWGQGFNFSV